ncbi:MAG TPA: acetyltransferase [Terriglobales bacterium]|jgi:sugar O-acyltransferase (sialic acid O-acetyltransferase NeuD family)|nr:acetyltransferase [Terriglobales bacterium]
MNQIAKLVIVGAGGLGREVLAMVRACNLVSPEAEVLGFLDSNPSLAGTQIAGVPVLGSDDWCKANKTENLRYVCAIGNPMARSIVTCKLLDMGCQFSTIVHPGVHLPDSVRCGVGTVIMAGTEFTTDSTVGSHVIIYLNCSITHDVVVKDFCLIASGCNLSGGSILETGVELGTGACVLPQRRVGAWSVIGAGAVVNKDIPSNSTAVGVPCRIIAQRP